MKALVLLVAILFSFVVHADDTPVKPEDTSMKGSIKRGAQKVKSKTKELTVKASKKVRKTLEKMEGNIED